MSGLRVVLVTRRYWPLTSGSVSAFADLATEFVRQGHVVRVLTAQWESHWSTEVLFREIPLTRFPQPAVVGWGTFRYMRSLSRWLRTHANDYDVIYVAGLRYDAYAVLGATSTSTTPVVLRVDVSGESGDCKWLERTRFGNRIRHRCMNADAFVVPSESIGNELTSSRFATNRLRVIRNGVPLLELATDETRQSIRASLADVNHDLATKPRHQVVISTVSLNASEGTFDLVRAWRRVLVQCPDAILWMIGDGPDRDDLFELILDLELRGRVLMPGTFDDVTDVIAAADLFVSPTSNESNIVSLLSAMSAGVPVVAIDIQANREIVEHETHGILAPTNDPNELAIAIVRQLQQRILAEHYAQAARMRTQNELSIQRTADEHIDLFQQLLNER